MMTGGSPTFANANYVIGRTEYDFWKGKDNRIGNMMEGMVVPIEDKATFIEPDGEVTSGITAVNAFGHTPGHMAYRLDKGSYHDRNNQPNPKGHLIRALMDDPDPNALRAFHTELCVPSPERLDLLAAHDMLRTERLDLDAKVARFFGKLEG